MTSNKDEDVSNGQRAFWVFLGFTLVGPFFAALAVVIVVVLAPVFKFDMLMPSALPPVGEIGLRAFVWSAIPSALAAIAIVPFVLKTGTFSVFVAAASGVIAFTVAALLLPFGYPAMLTVLAILAGLVAIAVRYAMDLGGLLRAD